MNEQTLNKPLSGEELIEIMVRQIKLKLQSNCFLAKHVAYPAFSFTAVIQVNFQNTGTRIQGTSAQISGSEGKMDPEAESETEIEEVSGQYDAPNIARRENDIPIPVITRTPQGGIEEKRIKYTDPKFAEKAKKGK